MSKPAGPKKPNLVSVTTINRDGSRFFLHPSDVSGWFTVARRVFALVLVAVYVLLPWIPINGHPAMFFDIANGRFHVFGLTFLTQDLWLLFFLLSGFGFALIYITSLFGRLWCGWACPYTVFLEHVFRRIERWIDGDAVARKQLDAAPWTGRQDIQARSETRIVPAVRGAHRAPFPFVFRFAAEIVRLHAGVADGQHRGVRGGGFPDGGALFLLRLVPRAVLHHPVPVRADPVGADGRRHHCHRLRFQARRAARQEEDRRDRRLHRLPPLRAGLPDRHRHPQRLAARVHRLRQLRGRLR